MTTFFLTMVWVAVALGIAALAVMFYILDRFVKLLNSIRHLSATYFPQELNDEAENPKRHVGQTSVTINDPIEWAEVDGDGRAVEPRD